MTAALSATDIIAEVARGLADAADDGCFDNPPCCENPPCSDVCDGDLTDLDEWRCGEEDREYWTKLARAGVERLQQRGHTIVTAKTDADTLTQIARLHDVGYGFPTVNGVRVEGAKARLYCVHCVVDYPCPTMALIPQDGE